MKSPEIIPEEWLMSYAAGALPEAHALLVASHAWYNADARETIAFAEELGGLLLEGQSEASLRGDVDASHITQKPVDCELVAASREETETLADSVMPAPLAEWLSRIQPEETWKFLAPGLTWRPLMTGPEGEKLWMLKAKPGAKIPVHDHEGLEMTLILSGYYDVDGVRYSAGCVDIADSDTCDHQPLVGAEEECICLVVTEGSVLPQSLMGKILMPIVGP